MFNLDTIAAMFNSSPVETILLKDLILDAGTQQRVKLNAQSVENYTANFEEGQVKDFPPVDVVQLTEAVTMPDGSVIESGALILVDGFHRIDSANKAKLQGFHARVAQGTLEDAKYYAMTANSTHGTQMGGKDYQKAIQELYNMSPSWREHGKGKEMAQLFGCSTKTIERALKAIKAAIKAEAFKMFEAGASDQDVAEFAVIHEKTAKTWREEWEASKPSNDPKDDDTGDDSEDPKDAEKNPLDLSFGQVLRLKNPTLKAQLLKMLMDAIKTDNSQGSQEAPEEPQEAPKAEPKQPEPEAEKVEPEAVQGQSEAMTALFNEWKAKDCWGLFGKTRDQFLAMKNPKTAVKRAYTKLLKQCHSDIHGDNEALELLKTYMAEVSRHIK